MDDPWKLFFAFFSSLALSILSGLSSIRGCMDVSAKCDSEIVAAAYAADVPSAQAHLKNAIAYLEEKKFTEGSMQYFQYDASEDVGGWYKRLKSCEELLAHCSGEEVSIDGRLQEKLVWNSLILNRLKSSLLNERNGEVQRPSSIWELHYKYTGLLMRFLSIIFLATSIFSLGFGMFVSLDG